MQTIRKNHNNARHPQPFRPQTRPPRRTGWRFDTDAGIDEIVKRRIGENELSAIATLRACVDAQRAYAAEPRDDTSVRQFAQAATQTARAAAQARAAALRATVKQRIASAKSGLEQKIEDKLHDGLNQRFALGYDWWDPYVGLRVHHTDAEREWAYDRKSHIGQFDKGLDEAKAKGWTVVSMKDDWKTIFPSK